MQQPEKPHNIPQQAIFNETNQEWELGQKNATGKNIGKWTWWRKDGTLVCETYYEGETGQNFTFTRYHQDGTFSQKGTFRNGQYHDILTCQISENPTTEGVNDQQKLMHPEVFSWKIFFDNGEYVAPSIFFNKNGEEISLKGTVKPKNIPSEAVSVMDGTWKLHAPTLRLLQKFNGVLYYWDEQGRKIREAVYNLENGNILNDKYYDEAGNVYCERDFTKGKGYTIKPVHNIFYEDILKQFESDIYKITYDFTVVDVKTGQIDTTKTTYFDKEDNLLSITENTNNNNNNNTKKNKTIMTPQRPQSVPQEATWNEKNQEWELGQKNAQGKNIGKWLWWRKDGTQVCETHYEGETGNDFSFTRYHQDGTFSWKGSRKNNLDHGLQIRQISENPTTEMTNQLKDQVPNIFRMETTFNQGKPVGFSKFFNKNGDEISYKGVVKPKNLPEDAIVIQDGSWRLDPSTPGVLEKYNGVLYDWDEQGRKFKETTFNIKTGDIINDKYFDNEGNIYTERDFIKCEGYALKPQHDVFYEETLKQFEGHTYKITYNFRAANAKTGLISTTKKEYFDKNGNQLNQEGNLLVKPTPNATMILKTGYSGTEIYFYEAQFNNFDQKDGLITYWYDNGKKRFEAYYHNNNLKTLKTYDKETGDLKTEEMFYSQSSKVIDRGGSNELKCFVESLKIYDKEITREFLMNEKGFCTTVNQYKNGNLISTLKNSDIKDNLTLSEFAEEFNKRYAGTDEEAEIIIDDYFDIRDNKMYVDEVLDEFFKVVVLNGDAAGNELIVIQEPGEFFGKVYDNDHEEGLYSVAVIDEYLEELTELDLSELEDVDENIDLENIENLDKNTLIKLMPFYQNDTKIADSLNELMNMIYITSYEMYRTELADLEKIILNK